MTDSPLARVHPHPLSSSAWQRSLTAYAVGAALLLLAGREVVAAMIGTWSTTTTYHHGFIVLPICLFLVWRQRRRLALVEPTGSALGALCLVPFGLLWALGSAGDVLFFQQLGLIGLLAGLVPALMGWRAARVLWFPLLFAFAMVPFGEELVPALQDVTAQFSVRLLRLIGIPVFHEGVLIQTPTGFFEVAEACAGLRFLIANLVVAFLFCHFTYRVWWKWVAFMALATIIPILANGLRAFGIIYVAYKTDNTVAVGVDHLVYGWGFFTIVMLLSLFVGNLFADRGMAGLGTVEPAAAAPRPASDRRRLGIGFAALAIAVALAGPVWG
ncbi:MAG: exosortase A, partial [Tistlia sp.]